MSILKPFLFVVAPLVCSFAQFPATSEPVKVAVQPPVASVLSPAIPEALALYQSGKFEAAADKYRIGRFEPGERLGRRADDDLQPRDA